MLNGSGCDDGVKRSHRLAAGVSIAAQGEPKIRRFLGEGQHHVLKAGLSCSSQVDNSLFLREAGSFTTPRCNSANVMALMNNSSVTCSFIQVIMAAVAQV